MKGVVLTEAAEKALLYIRRWSQFKGKPWGNVDDSTVVSEVIVGVAHGLAVIEADEERAGESKPTLGNAGEDFPKE